MSKCAPLKTFESGMKRMRAWTSEGPCVTVPLLEDEEHPGFIESKWCANRFKPFLCVAPEGCAVGFFFLCEQTARDLTLKPARLSAHACFDSCPPSLR